VVAMAKRGVGGKGSAHGAHGPVGGNNGGGVDAAEELLLEPPLPSARRATTAGSTAATNAPMAACAPALGGSVVGSISRLATSNPTSALRAVARLSYNATISRFALAQGRANPPRNRPPARCAMPHKSHATCSSCYEMHILAPICFCFRVYVYVKYIDQRLVAIPPCGAPSDLLAA
jgi:hypothetical protein